MALSHIQVEQLPLGCWRFVAIIHTHTPWTFFNTSMHFFLHTIFTSMVFTHLCFIKLVSTSHLYSIQVNLGFWLQVTNQKTERRLPKKWNRHVVLVWHLATNNQSKRYIVGLGLKHMLCFCWCSMQMVAIETTKIKNWCWHVDLTMTGTGGSLQVASHRVLYRVSYCRCLNIKKKSLSLQSSTVRLDLL